MNLFLPKKQLGFILAIVCMMIFSTGSAIACSCYEKGSVCSAFGEASSVFVGKVIEGKSAERMSDMRLAGTNDLVFKFAVSKGFLNAKAGDTIAIHTGFGFGDCGYPFEAGQEYVVYAYEQDGQLKTGVCMRTSPISRAKEDIKNLPNLFKNTGGTLSGKLSRYGQSSLIGEPYQAVVGAIVRLVNDNRTSETKTNKDGIFSFGSLPTGRYKLEIPGQKGWELDDYEEGDFLLNKHGCVQKNLSLENDSEVKVTVRDPDGRPITNAWVEFIPAGVYTTSAKFPKEFSVTNPQGQLYMFSLPPGRYTVSINSFYAPDKKAPFPATFAPGITDRKEARIIEITPGAEIEPIEIRVRERLKEATVSGVVYWPDGTPAKNVNVGLSDARADGPCVNGCAESDINGKFNLTGYAGREYSVWARGDKSVGGREKRFRVETEILVLDDKTKPVRLVLREIKK